MEFKIIETQSDLEQIFPLIKELRVHLSLEEFLTLFKESHQRDHYQILAVTEYDRYVGAMGYRILFDLVHGKHLYIDDLVVTKDRRSHGIGSKLLNEAKEIARKNDCSGLRLCTGVDNEGGKKFYERHGWNLRSVAYKKKL